MTSPIDVLLGPCARRITPVEANWAHHPLNLLSVDNRLYLWLRRLRKTLTMLVLWRAKEHDRLSLIACVCFDCLWGLLWSTRFRVHLLSLSSLRMEFPSCCYAWPSVCLKYVAVRSYFQCVGVGLEIKYHSSFLLSSAWFEKWNQLSLPEKSIFPHSFVVSRLCCASTFGSRDIRLAGRSFLSFSDRQTWYVSAFETT